MLTATDHNKLHLWTKFMKNPENPHPLKTINVIGPGKEPSNASSRNLLIYFGEMGGRSDRKKN